MTVSNDSAKPGRNALPAAAFFERARTTGLLVGTGAGHGPTRVNGSAKGGTPVATGSHGPAGSGVAATETRANDLEPVGTLGRGHGAVGGGVAATGSGAGTPGVGGGGRDLSGGGRTLGAPSPRPNLNADLPGGFPGGGKGLVNRGKGRN